MKFETTRPFERDYARLPAELKDRADKQLTLLLANPLHPSLRLKRLQGSGDFWEVRVSRSYRVTLEIAQDTYILRRVGTHDVLRQP